MLDHKPDLLFVEFAVNDGGAPTQKILKAMEGIIRQTLKNDPTTDICFIYTLTEQMLPDLEGGKFPHAASVMEQLADHYHIPSIHYGVEVASLHKAGKLIFKGELPKTDADKAALGDKIVFSGDGVHPHPETGHQLYLECIQRSWPKIEAQSAGPVGPHKIPAPLVADNWEKAKMLPLSAAKLSSGWEKLDQKTHTIGKRFAIRVPEMWKTNKAGETLSFKFRGNAALIYDVLGPDCGQVAVQIDEKPVNRQPRFDSYCTYHRLATLPLVDEAGEALHTITIRLLPDQPDKLNILHKRAANANIKELDPKLYNDIAWYAGAILIIGDLVE